MPRINLAKPSKITLSLLFLLLLLQHPTLANDGYRLWLQYAPIEKSDLAEGYKQQLQQIYLSNTSATMQVIQDELDLALGKMLALSPRYSSSNNSSTAPGLIIASPSQRPSLNEMITSEEYAALGEEGYLLRTISNGKKTQILITGNTDIALLYGTYELLRKLQTHSSLEKINLQSSPKTAIRVLNHWDNPDRTVERGYAGASIWDWHRLPDYIHPQYLDYARANASIGINGTVLTNVNANAQVLTPYFLRKVAKLAEVFRPYGIKVYLTARFSAPMELGGLSTADPTQPEVQEWWDNKVNEIYEYIPDFGGFLVKADSEGQPGPQNYDRSQAQGANMLAQALKAHQGIVMWRAFVYTNETPDDRAKQAYNEFKPLDGDFDDNVIVQVKNGAIDFQPREPFHPMFGAMPQTPLMMEFQITQEYLGQGTHLVYLAPMYEEVLDTDTYAEGPGTTVAGIIEGRQSGSLLTGMAGVSNIGTDRNWTGHLFGQANWYAFGKLAWDPSLSSEEIAEEWSQMTFTNDPSSTETITRIMMLSHEAAVNYMTPLGLHHIMGWSHHYGPGPWVTDKHRDDWTSTYYHQADRLGIGFDRTVKGSNALGQYAPEIQKLYGNPATCPEKYLLWFHHLPWEYVMPSGRSLWEEIALHYQKGVDQSREMLYAWQSLSTEIDPARYHQVESFLRIQEKEAIWWKDACLLYFQQFSQRPFPKEVEKPEHSLEYYQNYEPKFVPGI
ncbi:alpha-glucuronidase family glycosyl hydrolase [Echinicola pacifica]|uniref:alpha-glucuronidase family glycosyl hydrolase n=1 Tax=Echinicola pacifica TaxID=346377 RepID=UPI00037CB320|nr:alpha-glucuronidase family glycosyl hydrolase [Echinicola pacifica]